MNLCKAVMVDIITGLWILSLVGSTCSTHFLVEAQKAGYEVNKTALKRSLDHLSYKVKQKMNTYNYRYRGADNNWYNKLIFPRDALYTLYFCNCWKI